MPYRELDDALRLTTMAGERLADARTGRNGRHALVGLLRQSVFGRLAGYEDVNDAERLRYDPAMRWIVGGKAAQGCAASPSQMGRFETRWLGQVDQPTDLAAADFGNDGVRDARRPNPVHDQTQRPRRPPCGVPLKLDQHEGIARKQRRLEHDLPAVTDPLIPDNEPRVVRLVAGYSQIIER